MIDKFDRIKLGHFPTPIEYLNNITEHLNGPQIYIKRDDCTGLATGGNKTRKLEFLMPDAIKNQADLVVTVGAVQSNHTRQTAAACAKLGLKCLIVLEQRLKDAPNAYMTSGNVFLDKIFGAEVVLCPSGKDVKEYAEEIMAERKNDGANPYYIPVGGSNHIGELGYIECMREIIEDDKDNSFTHIVLASGSGGTHAGSIAGKTYYKSNIKIVGIIHGFNAKHIEHADMLIAVSEKVKQFLIDSGCTKPIYVVPNMVKIGNDAIYRDLPATPLIGAMGVFRRKKGFHILIKALSILKQKGVPFKAVIAGKGRITWYLQYLRWKLDLKNELTMRGWVSNKDRDAFVDSIDLYVLPSRTETFGMVVVEAMARMKRVIATICGGPEHIITHGKNGYLIESGDAEILANQIIEVMGIDQNTDKIPNNALDSVARNYSTKAVSKSLKKIVHTTQ